MCILSIVLCDLLALKKLMWSKLRGYSNLASKSFSQYDGLYSGGDDLIRESGQSTDESTIKKYIHKAKNA